MSRPLTRAQACENQAFLKALRRTGNVRLAARECGLKYGTMQHRRRQHPAFAHGWDAALTFALAKFAERGPSGPSRGRRRQGANPHRTEGGEPVVVRRNDGKLQMRAAQPGKLTKACEQAFLAALAATANVRLAAAAAGASPAAFYRRRRRNPAFAREYRLALQMGYDRLEAALLEAGLPESFEDDSWRHNDPPPIPPMSVNQALQLMYLHQKEARLGGTPEPLRRRKGESHEARRMRLELIADARRELDRELYRVGQAMRLAEEEGREDLRPAPPVLPDISQVTGWSRAGGPGKGVHDLDRALFGGWRIDDLRRVMGEGAPRELELKRVTEEEAERLGAWRQPRVAKKRGRQV